MTVLKSVALALACFTAPLLHGEASAGAPAPTADQASEVASVARQVVIPPSSTEPSVADAVRRVAVTFDDLPYAGSIGEGPESLNSVEVAQLNAEVRRILERHGAPATGFVVEQSAQALGPTEARGLLSEWAAGQLSLGNHSSSHADSNSLSIAEIEQEVVKGEETIRPIMEGAGKPLTFMRFPMNHTGNTPARVSEINAMLSAHGYRVAASTIDTSDYVFESAYRAALDQADDRCAEAIKHAYIAHTATQIDYYAGLSQTVLGYPPPEIALLHLNRINAAALDDLLNLYQSKGYAFVTLEEAQADPAYQSAVPAATRFGPMWAYRWARERGVTVDGRLEREPDAWVAAYPETRQCAAA